MPLAWVYDASGNKLKKVVKSGGAIQYTQHYISGIEYRQGSTGTPAIEAIYHPEGRVFYTSATASRYEYSIRDHASALLSTGLGNTRITFSDLNANNKVDVTNTASNEVLQENHYYPFGLGTNGAWMNNAALDNLYQYNGKELNNDWGLNMLDYGARMYMADLGRWNGVDEFGELYLGFSPYSYVLNSPIKCIDLDGRYLVDSDGNTVSMRRNKESKEIEFYSKKGKEINEGTLEVLNMLGSTKDGRALLGIMSGSSRGFQFNLSEDIMFSMDDEGIDLTNGITNPPKGSNKLVQMFIFVGNVDYAKAGWDKGIDPQRTYNVIDLRSDDDELSYISMSGEEILNMMSSKTASLASIEKQRAYKSMTPAELYTYQRELLKEKYSSRESFIFLVSYHEANHGADLGLEEEQVMKKELRFFMKHFKGQQ